MKMPYETILSDVKRSSKHCSLTESATIYRNDGPTGGSRFEDPMMVGCYGGLLTVPYTAGVETVERAYKYEHLGDMDSSYADGTHLWHTRIVTPYRTSSDEMHICRHEI